MHENELQSFIFKFNQLWKAGITAHLDLDTHAGQAWVGLRVQLGQVHEPPPFKSHRQHRSPAYHRRQNRRQAARAAEVTPKVVEEAEEVFSCVQEVSAEKATEENVPDDIIMEKNAEEASDKSDFSNKKDSELVPDEKGKFSCPICDFDSGLENGLAIHMGRKHGNIEQLDGAANDANDDDDLKYERSSYYWLEGRIGISYETYCDIVDIIDESDIDQTEKKIEKEKVKEARKRRFGHNYKNYPPWK